MNYKRFEQVTTCLIFCCLIFAGKKGDAKLIAQYHGIRFFTPLHKAPANDVFAYKDMTGISGQIIYDVLTLSPPQKHVVVRTIKDDKQTAVLSLPVETSRSLLGVKMSPNGRYVLMRIGTMGDLYDEYSIYFWDLKTNSIFAGPVDLTYYFVEWSPSSKFIAYCQGGDVNGDEYGVAGMNSPLKLFIFDISSKQKHFIALGQTLRYFSWTNRDTLLLSLPNNYPLSASRSFDEEKTNQHEIYNVDEASAQGGKLWRVIDGGYHAVSSPSGKYIVYLAHTNDETKKEDPKYNNYPYLSIFNTKTKKTHVVPGEHSDLFDLRWTPDNKKVIMAQYSYFDAKGTLKVSSIDMQNHEKRALAQIDVQDSEPTYRNSFQPQFRVLDITPDNSSLIVQSQQFGKALGGHYYDVPYSLSTVGLATGTVATLCKIERIFSFDWHSSPQ